MSFPSDKTRDHPSAWERVDLSGGPPPAGGRVRVGLELPLFSGARRCVQSPWRMRPGAPPASWRRGPQAPEFPPADPGLTELPAHAQAGPLSVQQGPRSPPAWQGGLHGYLQRAKCTHHMTAAGRLRAPNAHCAPTGLAGWPPCFGPFSSALGDSAGFCQSRFVTSYPQNSAVVNKCPSAHSSADVGRSGEQRSGRRASLASE